MSDDDIDFDKIMDAQSKPREPKRKTPTTSKKMVLSYSNRLIKHLMEKLDDTPTLQSVVREIKTFDHKENKANAPDIMPFGKHKGECLRHLAQLEAGYLNWVISQD